MNNDISGVYYILNKKNNKIYIGSSKRINRRFYEHRYFLNNQNHGNEHLQKAWNKYGEDNFEFGIIEIFNGNDDELRDVEQIWMDYFSSYNKDVGYNISAFAEGSGGYIVSEQTREKLKNFHMGRKASEETKQKLSSQRKGELNGFFGKQHTEESRQKMRKAKLGNKITETQKKALDYGREVMRELIKTPEYRKKLSISKQGEKSSTSKLKESDVIEILKELKGGRTEAELSEQYGVAIPSISRIKNRKRWGYLYEKFPELYT